MIGRISVRPSVYGTRWLAAGTAGRVRGVGDGRRSEMRRRLGNYVRRSGLAAARIGAELAFLPADSAAALRKALPDSAIKDALFVLERLRAVKRPDELQKLLLASEKVIDLTLAVIAKNGPGATKRELTEALRREEIRWETIDRSSEKARCGSECISLLPSPWT